MDVHEYLYDEASAIFGSRYSDKYDSAIRWTDGNLDILFSYLMESGLDRNTLVVVTADHGEAFHERGLEGHARAVYRETTEIPFVISFPFRLDPGAVVSTRTQNVDLWPTVLDLLGLPIPEDVDGRSRMPEILAAAAGDPLPPDSTIGFAYLDGTWGQRDQPTHERAAVTEGTYRYLFSRDEEMPNRIREELFDAETDPAELSNRAGEEPERLARMRGVLEEKIAESPSWGQAPKRELDEFELNQLRALGYAIP
jgi:arylsulfatase A-like enzyme